MALSDLHATISSIDVDDEKVAPEGGDETVADDRTVRRRQDGERFAPTTLHCVVHDADVVESSCEGNVIGVQIDGDGTTVTLITGCANVFDDVVCDDEISRIISFSFSRGCIE